MRQRVARILLLFGIILAIIAILSSANFPSIETSTTVTNLTTKTYEIPQVITSLTYISSGQEVTSSNTITYIHTSFIPINLKTFFLSKDLNTEYIVHVRASDVITVRADEPIQIQIRNDGRVEAEVNDIKELRHIARYDGKHMVNIKTDEEKFNEDKSSLEVFIGVIRPVPGSIETVVKTIEVKNSYSTSSIEERLFTSTFIEEKTNSVATILKGKKSLFPSWFISPFITVAIVLILSAFFLKPKAIDKSIDYLGALLLEDKYYRKDELFGKIAYNSKAMKIGEVVDVGYSKEGKVALVVSIMKGKEKIIPFTEISEIGDIILLSSKSEKEREKRNFKISRN